MSVSDAGTGRLDRDAFRDATGEMLISKTAVSEITDRIWESYQAFCARGLGNIETEPALEVVGPEDVDLYHRVERSPLESAAPMQLSFDVRGQPLEICDALVPDTLLGQVSRECVREQASEAVQPAHGPRPASMPAASR